MGTWVRRDIRRSTLDIPNDRVALRPVVPHLKLLQERGTFIACCCIIKRYFNLPVVKEVAASAAAALM